ncbi:MAG: OmpA family protein [Candidatus Aminicenantes bacterium]|nr:OmpA family protein [Candidatus Aminicenantes bacterium]
MKTGKWIVFAATLLLIFTCAAFVRAQDEEVDVEGSKDHPLLSRMKNFFITDYLARYDEHEFYISDEETKVVEGDRTFIVYRLKEGSPQVSPLQIRRNYGNALKTLGATLIRESDAYACWKLVKGDQEIWIDLSIHNDGWNYELNFIQIAAMIQEVTANEMLDALNKDGFIALYINFDTGKYDLKPEMRGTIDQIVSLLKDNEDLQISIEGHTDNVGPAEANKVLSEQRAKSVMAAVVAGGVDASRINAVGWGQERPIADNRSEEGRAKNRRVEIVKK